MSIPASYIVNITPRLLSAGGNDLEFNGLFLTENALIPLSSPVLTFANADSVGEYFGVASTEYAVSVIYFKGFNNSQTKPKHVHFARRVSTAAPAYLRGGKFTGKLADITAITAGDMSIDVDGTTAGVSGVDFSADTSYSDVASTLQTALQGQYAGTLVSFDSVTGAFTITSPTSGNTSTITYATGTIAGLLNLTAEDGAVLSQGSAVLTVTENMALVKEATQNWVSFTTLYSASNDEHLALAEWASGQDIEYAYIGWSTDPKLVTQGSTDSIQDLIKEAGYGATEIVYDNVNVATFVLGAIGSIAWDKYQGAINFAFKSVDGVGATVTSQTDADVLLAKGVSFVGNFATRNDDFTFFYDAKVNGDYGYLDTFINTIWLKNVMQLNILKGLTNTNRAPYNDVGYSLIRAWLQDPINRALNNGVIDSGVSLSESQRAQVMQETGKDLTTELTTNGYAIIISDADATTRVGRKSPDISVYYTYGGSINKIDVTSTAIV